ncbi:MAG: hypothetical protein NTZ43_01285 [Gemmatimonadetes bacterium]|nr:hypothetical protein [Gemmatimonadota bacterium]
MTRLLLAVWLQLAAFGSAVGTAIGAVFGTAPQVAQVAAPAARAPSSAVTPIASAIARRAKGDSVTLAGRATSGTGQLQSSAFDISMQDATAGIRVFSKKFAVEVHEGDSVVATGVVQTYAAPLNLLPLG